MLYKIISFQFHFSFSEKVAKHFAPSILNILLIPLRAKLLCSYLFFKMSLDKCRGIYHPFLMGLLTNGRILQLGSSAGDGDIDLKLTRYLAVIALVMELLSSKIS